VSGLLAFRLLGCWFQLQLNRTNLGPRRVFGQVENAAIIFLITFGFCVQWICLINEISVEYQLDVYSFPQPINRIDKVWKTIRKLERGPW
jgi:hypothetical protein